MAMTVITAPTPSTVNTHPRLFGNISVSEGIAMPKGIPTAVAATATMAPARKQNIKALTML